MLPLKVTIKTIQIMMGSYTYKKKSKKTIYQKGIIIKYCLDRIRPAILKQDDGLKGVVWGRNFTMVSAGYK
jgi:hypothetical protein